MPDDATDPGPAVDAPSVWVGCPRCGQLAHVTATSCPSCGRVARAAPRDPDATQAMDLALIGGPGPRTQARTYAGTGARADARTGGRTDAGNGAGAGTPDGDREAAARLIAALATPAGDAASRPLPGSRADELRAAVHRTITAAAAPRTRPLVITALAVVAAVLVASAVLVWGQPSGRPAGSRPVASVGRGGAPSPVLLPASELTVTASSVQQPESGIRYDPANLVDGRADTAWNSDGRKDGKGPGLSLSFRFATAIDLRSITLLNGYQKLTPRSGKPELDLFALNSRVRRLTVTTDTGTLTWDLADSRAPQVFTHDFGSTSAVRFDVVSVYPGSRYDDLAISEVGFAAAT